MCLDLLFEENENLDVPEKIYIEGNKLLRVSKSGYRPSFTQYLRPDCIITETQDY